MTTMTAGWTRSGHDGARRAIRRPIIDLAPWLAPLAWMTVLAVVVVALGAAAVLRGGVPSAATATREVRVASADTLWSIAESSRMAGMSTAQTVETITRMNGLQGSVLRVGAVLRVPTAVDTSASFAQADAGSGAR